MIRSLALLLCSLATVSSAAPPGAGACVGSLPIGSFRLTAVPAKGGPPLPLRSLNNLKTGETLHYEPVKLPDATKQKAQLAVVLVEPSQDLVVLDPQPAAKAADWKVTHDTAVVALVFGPHGLNVKKVKSLVGKDDELLSQLADYAEQTEKIEALVDAVAKSEQSGASLDAALAGFSAQYGVALPKVDPHAPTDQQASALLKAMMPSVSAYDPLVPHSTVQQSTGLAASLAGMFFGTPAGLIAGGASLFQNLRVVMFPETDFRSAIARLSEPDRMELCAKPQPPKAHTRVAYLWAHRVPALPMPAAAIADSPHLPIGLKSTVHGTDLAHLDRARNWRLVPLNSAASFPATVGSSGDSLALDLTQTRAPAGEYRLAAEWDWDTLQVGGTVHLDALENLGAAQLTRDSRDRLVEGSGRVPVDLTGPDFQFVEKAAIVADTKWAPPPAPLPFTLPQGKRAGAQRSLELEMDTNALRPGAYKLLLTQADGKTYPVPVTVHPPPPKFDNLPVRVNLGEASQPLPLHGTGMDRIERMTSPAGEIALAGGAATIHLRDGLKAGEEFLIELKLQGIDEPVPVPRAIAIAAPRPRIVSVRKSFPGQAGLSLRAGELPAGVSSSFELSVENADGAPLVDLACGEKSARVTPQVAGAGALFFAIDPGTVGPTGCSLSATVTVAATGTSDATPLGRVVRVPRIAHFELTDEKLRDGVYAGIIQGEDLETIAKTGWDEQNGLPVEGLPTPLPGVPRAQTLKIALPWPAPAPHAPLFIWLRGEDQGRTTGVKY